MQELILQLIGYGSGIAGADLRVAEGPQILQQSTYFTKFAKQQDVKIEWEKIISPTLNQGRIDEQVAAISTELAMTTAAFVQAKKFFTVIGGDHTAAIGTWSGAQHALSSQGDLGLIWIDAHMDGHTPETSLSGRIHGMPVASLLGLGYPSLTHLLNPHPKIKPENLCLIGTRSFEAGEAALLKRLNVRIFYMEEVKERGIDAVLEEAFAIVTQDTAGFGISLDLDGIDPEEAPAVDVPEQDGIHAVPLAQALSQIVTDPRLVGMEIVEFDPSKDKNQLTEKLLSHLLVDFIRARKQ